MKKILLALMFLSALVPGQALANSFSGQAAVVQGTALGQPVDLVDTGPVPSTGGQLESSLLDLGVPGIVAANVGHAAVVAMGDASRAEASVAKLNLTVGTNTIGANLLMARATAVCSDAGAVVSGSSNLVDLVINGMPVDVNAPPNTMIGLLLPGDYVIVNEQNPQGNAIDVAALHVVVNGVADLRIAYAHADITCAGGKVCPQDKDFVTGGGRIPASGDQASFGVAGGIKNGGWWGHLTYIDHGTGMKVKGTGVTGYTTPDPVNKPNLRHIKGNCEINGASGYTYDIDVDDEGEPGINDTFYIKLSNGYSAGSKLDGGNIQLHTCK